MVTNFNTKGSKLIHESFVSSEISDLKIESDYPGSQMGTDLAVGDFNNDGVEDLVFSEPLHSNETLRWNGKVNILYGNSYKERSLEGATDGEQLGRALAVGDINGDGIDDLVIGAHDAKINNIKKGRIDIVYGGQGVDMQADMSIFGQNEKEAFGLVVEVYDVDIDGDNDIVVGAPLASYQNKTENGAVYIYLNENGEFQNQAKVIEGKGSGERFGSAIQIGNMIGDEYPEMLIGAYRASDGEGVVYFYEGRKHYANNTDDHEGEFRSSNGGNWFGFDIELKDLNGDGFEDVAISSFPYWDEQSDGGIEIFLGGERVNIESDVKIFEPMENNLMSSDILLEDLDDDQQIDLILGAPGKKEHGGEVYIFNRINDQIGKSLKMARYDFDEVIHGGDSGDWFGRKLAALDINKDGFKDLAISSVYADSSEMIDNGKVEVLFGDADGHFGNEKIVADQKIGEVSRGLLVKEVVERFDLVEKKKDFLDSCYQHIDFCLFNFANLSSYKGLRIEDQMILYPDVKPGSPYYESINKATLLGMVQGYTNEKESPFRPNVPSTRIQALRVVLGAAELVPTRYKFELISDFGSYQKFINQESYFEDIVASNGSMWWYPRYTNFAVENGLIDKDKFFRPGEYMSEEELDDLINRTLEFISKNNEKVKL